MDNRIKYIAMRLSAIDSENIEAIYEKKFETWLYKNSSEKEWLIEEELPHLKFNPKGKIINAEFNKRTKNRLELTEKQFREHELFELSKLNYDTLKTNQKATHNVYKGFLESKLDGSGSTQNFRQDIFTSLKASMIFEKLHDEFKDEKKLLANYSAIYRLMIKGELIRETFKPEMFKKFISKEPYSIIIGNQLKTLERIGEANIVKQRYNDLAQTIKPTVV